MAIITNLEKQVNEKRKKMPNNKKIGIILVIIASIGYLGLFIKAIPFLHTFLLGTFGLFAYVLFLAMYFVGVALIKGARYVYSKRYIAYLLMGLISVLAIFHIAFCNPIVNSYGEYLSYVYTNGITVGGVLLGLLVYPLQKLLFPIGAIFLFLILLGVSIWLIYDYLTRVKYLKQTDTKIFNKKTEKIKSQNISPITFELKDNTKIGLDAEIEKDEKFREQTANKLGLNENVRNERFVDKKELNSFAGDLLNSQNTNSSINQNSYNQNTEQAPKKLGRLEPTTDYSGTFGYNLMNKPVSKPKSSNYDKNREFLEATIQASNYIAPKNMNASENSKMSMNEYLSANFGNGLDSTPKQETTNYSNDYKTVSSNEQEKPKFEETLPTSELDKNIDEIINQVKQEVRQEPIAEEKNETIEQKFDVEVNKEIEQKIDETSTNSIEEIDLKNFELPQSLKLSSESRRSRGLKHSENQTSLFTGNQEEQQEEKKEKPVHRYKRYVYPTCDLLSNVSSDASSYNENVEENARAIENTLNNFGIAAKVVNTTIGPSVTRFELDMPQGAGISVNKIQSYSNDIAMAVASSHGVRIQSPIPGKSLFGVEIPNQKVSMVGLREILESKEFLSNKYKLAYCLGKEVSGQKVVADMHDMPHMLVAGSTGSGKSVALNTIIISMLYKYSPEELRFILVDPKQVEFFVYNGLPHLLTPEVIVDPVKALNSLNWAIDEMERRYTEFREHGVKQLVEYNNLPEVKNHEKQMMPQIVIIIDEVGDIMSMPQVKKDFEEKVRRLTQKARAAGIHLILATQRPSVDVITGVIKSNLPSRMAFAVTNYQDSKTILDKGGAEKLLGKGDMLFSPQGTEPYRVQGCFISNEEINNIVSFIKDNNESYFDEDIDKAINKQDEPDEVVDDGTESDGNSFDPLLPEALKLVIKNGYASASMLQRRFSIGNPKAARIIDQMEQAKFIGPMNGSKPRTVYITAEQYKALFGEGIDE
ncbi:MAG: hypothetical protein KBT30_00055 [Clostridiales bacterium]|nr:hypothetical protein [Candidatus Apopatousia equi]